MDRISVYLKTGDYPYSPDQIKELASTMKFTIKQSLVVTDFATRRGECLVFEGKREDAVDVVEKLTHIGIRCEARSKGIMK